MSAAEIIEELPRLTEAERRAVRDRLIELVIGDPEVEDCDLAAIHGAQLLDRLDEDDAHRILQVSRTIAGSDALAADHVMEAVQLRSLDR